MGSNSLATPGSVMRVLIKRKIERVLPKYKGKPEGIFGKGKKFAVEVISGILIQQSVESAMKRMLKTDLKYKPNLIAAVTLKVMKDVASGRVIPAAVASEILKLTIIEQALTGGIPQNYNDLHNLMRARVRLKPGSTVEQLYDDISKVKMDAAIISAAIFASEHIGEIIPIN